MHIYNKTAFSALTWSAMFVSQLQAYLPPISFENPEYVAGQTVGETQGNGWSLLSGMSSVSPPGTGFGGGQALKLEANPQQEPYLTRDLAWDPAQKTAFIDLQLKHAADPENSEATFYVNGTQLAFQVPQGGNIGEIWVYNGSEGTGNVAQWAKTVGTFTLAANGLTASDYTRITLRHDYQRNIWDLFINGKLAAANLAFEGRGAALEKLELYGSRVGDTLIDDLSAQTTNMLFTDADKDGLPDSWETANGSNPNLYDRDNIKPGTGKSFLDLYMDSLWLGGLNGIAPLPAQGSIPPLTILGNHQHVTSLKGSLSVGGDGSSSYSIPIDIPKGTAGMEPKVSLNYSSSGGNGIAGLGWSIGGLQSITRGAASFGKDGFQGAVRFDGNDRFFFNGERLICVSGTYGSMNSVYRTEIDSFSRITLKGGNQNTSASWWQIETKAGLIIDLGNSADSKVLATAANAPITWDVSRVSDTAGNYYTVCWVAQAGNLLADRSVASISYTGNSNGLAPYCEIAFQHEARPDKTFAYHPTGLRFESNKRLSSIVVKTGGTINHAYFLSYSVSAQSGRSVLSSMLKQSANGYATSPTVFGWQGTGYAGPKWAKVENDNLPVYNGGGFDAQGSNINAFAETTATSIRLEGGVARAVPQSPALAVSNPSFVEFEFRAERLDKGAYLIIDKDTGWNSSGDFGIHISPGAGTSSPLGIKRTVIYGVASAPQWQTYRVALQGNSNSSLNLAAGSYPYLAFLNYDQNGSNGTGWSEFRNIRFGTAAELDNNQVPPVSFPASSELPRFYDNGNGTRGMRMIDFNSDGLIDLTDFRVLAWRYDSTNNLVADSADRVTGNVYLNNGSGFYGDTTFLPPNRNPLTVTDNSSHSRNNDLVSAPCDINGDGKLDVLTTDYRVVNSQYYGSTTLSRYRFLTHDGSGWVELVDYAPKFEAEDWGGRRQLISRDLIDFDRDGYPDLYVNTTENAWLSSLTRPVSTPPAKILNANSRTVFLNRVHLGQGWVRTDSLAPPENLLINENDLTCDIGRRLADIDGDGLLDYIRSSYDDSSSTWTNDRFAQRSWAPSGSEGLPSWLAPSSPPSQDIPNWWLPNGPYPATSLMGGSNPQACDANAPLVRRPQSSTRASAGTHMVDVNGDGLTDVVRAYARKFNAGSKLDLAHSAWFNCGDTSGTTSRWEKDSSPYGQGYTLPLSLDSEVGDNQPCHQITDLNGDGLVDILYSRGGNQYVGPKGKRTAVPSDPFNGTNNGAFINTGKGWIQDLSWSLPDGFRLGKEGETNPSSMVADVNGDGFPDLITDLRDGHRPVLYLNQAKPEVITSITDGFGSELQVQYARINDPSATAAFGTRVYEKSTATLPAGHVALIDSRLVVSRYSEPDGQGGRRWKAQRYGDLRYDRKNEASLGFGWIEALDEANGQRTRTEYCRDFPFAGSPSITTTSVNLTAADIAAMPPNAPGYPALTPGEKVLTMETAAYSQMAGQAGTGGTIRRPVQTSSAKQLFDLDGTLKAETVTTQCLADFDAYGFVKKSTVKSLDLSEVVTTNTYTHTTTGGKWHLGRLSQSSVVKSDGGVINSTRTSSFAYSATTGLLTSETIEPGTNFAVTTEYTHDGFGNVTQTSVTARTDLDLPATETRTTATTYDGQGRFVIAESNAAGHTVSYSYDTQKALLQSTTGIDGLTTYLTYDPFGTLILTHHPDGTKTGEITGYATNASVPAAVAAHITNPIRHFRAKQASGTPVAKVYLDALGREIVTETTILRDGNATGSSRYGQVYAVTKYDSIGRKTAVSESFAASETPLFTTIQYDILSRTIRTNHPDGQWSGIVTQGAGLFTSHLGFQRVATYSKSRNQAGQILERWEDEHGRLAQSKDPSGQITTFVYDVENRLSNAVINNDSLLTNVYDQVGNKTYVIEANSGQSQSRYSGFGELVRSFNARGEETSYTYDSLGRPLTVVKPEGTYTTTYSTASGPTLGKPISITGSGAAAGYQETFSYDSLGRPVGTTKTQFGETFTTTTTYDALGRTASSTDAGGLTVFSEYDPTYSFPLKQKLAPGTYEGAGITLWQAGTFDSKGRTLTQTLAQGVTTAAAYHPTRGDVTAISSSWSGGSLQNKAYVWDALGNLASRTDNIAKRAESFGYDSLNRLASSSVSSLAGAPTSTVPPPQSYSYATNGNLLTKGSSATLTYANPFKPHAVSSAIVKGSSRTYLYDSAGYVYDDGKRQFEWTSFGQLARLEYAAAPELKDFSGNLVHPAGRVVSVFDFDSGGNRARQTKERTAANDSREIESTLYLGSYEREIHQTKADGNAPAVLLKTVHRHTLGGGIIYTRTMGGTAPGVKLMNVLADHLGSTDVILTGTWNGTAFASHTTGFQSFDAWGERRDAATQVNHRIADTDPFRTSSNDHDRGYTGHEQLDDSGLIHMNGRIYDPELGRFLSPDPVVQIPEYSQNFNRYSYVLNNPLNATDPSGFSFLSKVFHKIGSFIKENWRTVAVIVVAAVLMFTPGGQAFIGALTSALAPGLVGASWAVGAVTISGAQVAAGAAIGAITGGLNAALAGGDIGDILRGAVVGAIQGAIASGPLHGMEAVRGLEVAHIVGHGLLGGATNVAMGGKFQDGFLSAAASAGASRLPFGDGSRLSRTVKAGVVGGTASVLGGGKFANGAYTSAFQEILGTGMDSIGDDVGRLGRWFQEKTTSCLVGCTRNLLEAIGKPVPTESALRDAFDVAGGVRDWSEAGAIFAEAKTVLKNYRVEGNAKSVSLNGLLSIKKPAILDMRKPGTAMGHAILLESSSFKRFLYFFKYDRIYNIRDPWPSSFPGKGSPPLVPITYKQLSSNYGNYGFRYSGNAFVLD